MNKIMKRCVTIFACIFIMFSGCKKDDTSVNNINGIEVVSIYKGTFAMGSPTDMSNRKADEIYHFVTLTQDFKISKYTITNAQYAKFLNDNNIGVSETVYRPYAEAVVAGETQILIYDSEKTFDGYYNFGIVWDGEKWTPVKGKNNFPVILVTWYGAKMFAESIGGRLPSEAEWEYTCRAGTETTYNYGTTANGDYMWYFDNNSLSGTLEFGTKEVGKKLPNLWGLYDMHGNVEEWCNDWYAEYDTVVVIDPVGPITGISRIHRGGSCINNGQHCRSAYRAFNMPTHYGIIGFRVVFDT